MIDPFSIADSLRYIDDVGGPTDTQVDNTAILLKSSIASNGLKISRKLTPDLHLCLRNVCKKFGLNVNNVEAYVVSDPTVNAWCYRTGKNSCLIVLHSEIINLLNFDEIEFIIGHEIGHFLLDHHLYNIEPNEKNRSSKEFALQRAQEISADRIGLWACGDLNIAMESIIKMISGLSNTFLRFDINAFLSQVKDEKITYLHLSKTTHPSLFIRARALLRFSISKPFLKLNNKRGGSDLNKIDKLIRKDLKKYISEEVESYDQEVEEQFKFWAAVYFCVKDGDLTKEEQRIISNIFGRTKKNKLVNLVKDRNRKEVILISRNKLIDSVEAFRQFSPFSSWFKITGILNELERETKLDGLAASIKEII
tara:strand:- start:1459 stop:2556 length:1098 start_codon:yes stop_codon:yes gene_type:complete